jgi:hypothetical protein
MEFYSYLKLNNVTQNKQNQLPESTGCEPIQEKMAGALHMGERNSQGDFLCFVFMVFSLRAVSRLYSVGQLKLQ